MKINFEEEETNYKILFKRQAKIISELQDEIRKLKFDLTEERKENWELRIRINDFKRRREKWED